MSRLVSRDERFSDIKTSLEEIRPPDSADFPTLGTMPLPDQCNFHRILRIRSALSQHPLPQYHHPILISCFQPNHAASLAGLLPDPMHASLAAVRPSIHRQSFDTRKRLLLRAESRTVATHGLRPAAHANIEPFPQGDVFRSPSR